MQMNFEQARFNMIEQQIRTWEVLDQDVLDLLMKIHREDFMPEVYKQLAFADTNIPLAHGQITMTPKVEARMLQSVDIKQTDNVLEIGTGCAYVSALIASKCKELTSVDIWSEFTEKAASKLKQHNISNVTLDCGDAVNGWNTDTAFDVIVVTGSVPVLEPHFQQQLTINGRLFIIVGKSPVMDAILITRVGEQEWSKEVLFETDVPSLIGARDVESFKL